MLCEKIYLDVIDGCEALVFVSLASVGAGEPINVDNIAISPEARALLHARLQRDCPTLMMSRHYGDFKLRGYGNWEHGTLSFKPEVSENGLHVRTLREGDVLRLIVGDGCRREAIDYMVPCDNGELKSLDLCAGIDENALWERYFAAMRECGEEPTADVEGIRKTPTAFLTEAQMATVKRDYAQRCDQYDANEWHYHGDFLREKIFGEITTYYCKCSTDIKKICGILC